MKVCITSQGRGLTLDLDPKFGRCRYYIFIDTENSDFESIENPDINTKCCVGIKAGGFIASKDVKILITGKVGQHAFDELRNAGIKIVTGAKGKIITIIEDFKCGKFAERLKSSKRKWGHLYNDKITE